MNYRIDAMHCDGCARGVRAAIASADPQAQVTLDPTARTAQIVSKTPQAVLAALSEAGFPAVAA